MTMVSFACRLARRYFRDQKPLAYYMPYEVTGQPSPSAFMVTVCDSAALQAAEDTPGWLQAMHRKLVAMYRTSAGKQATAGLLELRKELRVQAEMLPSSKYYDYTKAFQHLNDTSNLLHLTSTNIQDHQRSPAAHAAAIDPTCDPDDRGILDVLNYKLFAMLEYITTPAQKRASKERHQRKKGLQLANLACALAHAQSGKAMFTQMLAGFQVWSGGLTVTSWDVLNRLGLVASYDTVMKVAKRVANKRKDTNLTTLVSSPTSWVNIAIDNLDFATKWAMHKVCYLQEYVHNSYEDLMQFGCKDAAYMSESMIAWV